MSRQNEAVLEENLIKQLISQEYERVFIKDDKALEQNLKSQLQKYNKIAISDNEFKKILNHLSKGNIFEKAKTLRDRFALRLDDGNTKYISFLDSKHWCQNLFQVASQIQVEGVYKNRYDVSILINGLPLVQIELKRRGLELKEAFNQTLRYKKHSYSANNALFDYIQIFIISNGVNTKYYANVKSNSMNFKQTFYWADSKNKSITNLKEFSEIFLDRCHISKMICRYIVLAEGSKTSMVLRAYQYYGVEAIINRVLNSNKNGYIWHTTGSGKTLTSFKTAQILMKLPKVYKVVFVVDRKDLDIQTAKEFNSFSSGSVDGTNNTRTLVRQFSDDTKLIVTTIQKLSIAISNKQYLYKMQKLKDKHIVFIFDECHRSQFGKTHLNITNFFEKKQMIGFTGTPIFAKNEIYKKTTKSLFDECLHKYLITDAINDNNVLKFSIEYIGRYKEKRDSTTNIDINVEAIDTKELLDSKDRVDKIVDYIIANHNRKTHSREFTAIMAVASIPMLIKYYESFKSKEHDLKIATIFSYSINEQDKDIDSLIDLDEAEGSYVDEEHINKHSKEKLDEFIGDYNKMFHTKFSTKDSQGFYSYYKDISERVKNAKVDILLVVNMFLTGFDSKTLNTLYVDKNLKYHSLIQAFSRTNRILNEQKSQGNIVCFRNLKQATDDAIALFSDENAKEIVLMESYEHYFCKFNEKYNTLIAIVPTVDSVDDLKSQDDKLKFIKAFRELMRIKNILDGFSDFKWSDLSMSEQMFEDYTSKYLDLYDLVKGASSIEKVSVLNDIDFGLELIHRDEINVNYIIKLLAQHEKVKDKPTKDKQIKDITNTLNKTPLLRSKKELIKKFIDEYLMMIGDSKDIEKEFNKFWDREKEEAFEGLCKEENLHSDEVRKVIDKYLYEQREPLVNDISKTLKRKHKYLERQKILKRVRKKIMVFVDKFLMEV